MRIRRGISIVVALVMIGGWYVGNAPHAAAATVVTVDQVVGLISDDTSGCPPYQVGYTCEVVKGLGVTVATAHVWSLRVNRVWEVHNGWNNCRGTWSLTAHGGDGLSGTFTNNGAYEPACYWVVAAGTGAYAGMSDAGTGAQQPFYSNEVPLVIDQISPGVYTGSLSFTIE